jgi:hypothetical protein
MNKAGVSSIFSFRDTGIFCLYGHAACTTFSVLVPLGATRPLPEIPHEAEERVQSCACHLRRARPGARYRVPISRPYRYCCGDFGLQAFFNRNP